MFFEKGKQKWNTVVEYAPYPDTWYEIGLYSMETGQLELCQAGF